MMGNFWKLYDGKFFWIIYVGNFFGNYMLGILLETICWKIFWKQYMLENFFEIFR